MISSSHRGEVQHPRLHQDWEGQKDREDLVRAQRLQAGALDEGQAVDIELTAGPRPLHEAHLIQVVAPNTVLQRHVGMALRGGPSTWRIDRGLIPVAGHSAVMVHVAQRPPWWVRGADRCRRNELVTGHPACV